MVSTRRAALSRHAAVKSAAKAVIPEVSDKMHTMLDALVKDGYYVCRAVPGPELPWTAADLDELRRLTLTSETGNGGREIAGFAFNTTKTGDAGDCSRRLAFLRNVTSAATLPPWLIPLFEDVERRVMEAIPDAKHDSLTRSVYYNVDSVPKSGHDAFDPSYHGPRVPAAGNPPHVDIKEFDEGVLEHVGKGRLPPVAIFISLEGFSMRVWPGGHEVLRRHALNEAQSVQLPVADKELWVPAGSCVVVRFDAPHAGGTTTNVRLCTVVGNKSFPRPVLEDGSAYEDNVNFEVMGRPRLFMNAVPKRSPARRTSVMPAVK